MLYLCSRFILFLSLCISEPLFYRLFSPPVWLPPSPVRCRRDTGSFSFPQLIFISMYLLLSIYIFSVSFFSLSLSLHPLPLSLSYSHILIYLSLYISESFFCLPNFLALSLSLSLYLNYFRVYLGEYRLYQNSEPLPRQKFYVR